MKVKFSSLDVAAAAADLQSAVGMRVIQAYDVDSKTYLLKLHRQEEKCLLLFESGIRFHRTEYDWPKNSMPSGFSMKLRKHLKNKRLESVSQVGIDRVVDLQFGINEAAYHVIIELYDRGNVVLTDHEYIILNILRPRQVGTDDARLAVREKYALSSANQSLPIFMHSDIENWFKDALSEDGNNHTLKKVNRRIKSKLL